ncbi:ParM/StbA family protein [Mechercharimyces sp. CAU 1602]|uniref:ParM/StbA family protein n=1 Tax=Mechercharimyces sp. CAU 1602 TaxID=2973933 RepID=UPI0021617B16|nr:ParM/StbA family protein [Mechercharimyces sp. CAU 1602]MCS1350334.1 ParM/StbA family protein [Mechercharimyces sp. CAU 1602]
MLVAVDCGRSEVKVVHRHGKFAFPAVIGEWRKLNIGKKRENEIEVVYEGERLFIGDLAVRESEFHRSMMTDTKAHEQTLILTLVAVYQANTVGKVSVVTGLPVELHSDDEKASMKKLITGKHRIEVNGISRLIQIEEVVVCIEGGGAFWANPQRGLVRIIDVGAKTVNFLTLKDKEYIDRESGTLQFGGDTTKTRSAKHLAERICGEVAKKWSAEDTVITAGAMANDLIPHFKRHFPNVTAVPDPKYANAQGFYEIGKRLL